MRKIFDLTVENFDGTEKKNEEKSEVLNKISIDKKDNTPESPLPIIMNKFDSIEQIQKIDFSKSLKKILDKKLQNCHIVEG